MTAKEKYEMLKANPSPRKFYARDLNRALRATNAEIRSDLVEKLSAHEGMSGGDIEAILQDFDKEVSQ